MPVFNGNKKKKKFLNKRAETIIAENSELEFPDLSGDMFGKGRKLTHSHVAHEEVSRIFISEDENFSLAHLVAEVEQYLPKIDLPERIHPCYLFTYWYVNTDKRMAKQLRVWKYVSDLKSKKTISGRFIMYNNLNDEFPSDTSVSDVALKFNEEGDLQAANFQLSACRSVEF